MTSWMTSGSRSMMFLAINFNNSKSESQHKDDHGPYQHLLFSDNHCI